MVHSDLVDTISSWAFIAPISNLPTKSARAIARVVRLARNACLLRQRAVLIFLVLGAFHFPFKITFKDIKIILFSAVAPRSVFEQVLDRRTVCKSHWNSCIAIALRCCCARSSICTGMSSDEMRRDRP